jgi:hypothetical protein
MSAMITSTITMPNTAYTHGGVPDSGVGDGVGDDDDDVGTGVGATVDAGGGWLCVVATFECDNFSTHTYTSTDLHDKQAQMFIGPKVHVALQYESATEAGGSN